MKSALQQLNLALMNTTSVHVQFEQWVIHQWRIRKLPNLFMVPKETSRKTSQNIVYDTAARLPTL
jgi:hypothetical protein